MLDAPADFLRRLSGRVHEVRTSVAIAVPVAQRIQLLQTTSVSSVRFRILSAPEIDRYVASGWELAGRLAAIAIR